MAGARDGARATIHRQSAVSKGTQTMSAEKRGKRPAAAPGASTDPTSREMRDICGALNALLADAFALYLKTKNFHWHVSGPHFRDYHLMLDEQSAQILAIADLIAERVRKVGGTTLRSISHIARLQRIQDNDAAFVTPLEMLTELHEDNNQLAMSMRQAHALCDENGDVASAGLLETWIDEADGRAWFLFEASRPGD
jgi:starvation-inducible DNA-binding protein